MILPVSKAPTLMWDDAQLVVARYNEDVRWLDALPGNQWVAANKSCQAGTIRPVGGWTNKFCECLEGGAVNLGKQ